MSKTLVRSRRPRFAAVARAVGYTTLALGLASACGGQSFNGGGASAGGTSNGAGTSSAGSDSRAGGSNGGNTAGRGSAAGNGGAESSDEACSGPAETGTCAAAFMRWSHDTATGLCRPIGYGGCGATKNNYETLEACQAACPGGTPNYDSCKVAADCLVVPAGCCGVCGTSNVTAHDLVAYNRKYADQNLQCANQDVACLPCGPPDPNDNTLRYFLPDCVRGECIVEDLRESAVSACEVDDDCRLRNGTACCPSCGPGQVVAVRADGSFNDLVCGDTPTPCPACAPTPPAGVAAVCGDTGHCAVSAVP